LKIALSAPFGSRRLEKTGQRLIRLGAAEPLSNDGDNY